MIISDTSEQKPMTVFDKTNPYIATLKERFLLTKPHSTKKTYHISLSVENLPFNVGDSLGIFAQNDPILVQHLLNALKANGTEMVVDPKSNQSITIRDFFSYKANLSRLNSSFLKLIYDYENEHEKKNHLNHLLQKENKTLLTQYLSSHDPLDVLKEYGASSAPLQEVCQQFGPLLPRFYSVASSPKALPNEVHLTVALFTFTHSGEQRFGVASHFLCHLAKEKETPIPLYVQFADSFTLPKDPDASIIMIGPGTGIAPFRAFLQERVHQNAKGKNWLFFGERNRATDFFYEDYWNELSSKNLLRLDVAFSRDQDEKVYVQNRMYENARDLWASLQDGAYLYVCGDAQRMAKDVGAMLIRIAKEQGNLSEEDAKAYFKTLRAQKRYLLDIY